MISRYTTKAPCAATHQLKGQPKNANDSSRAKYATTKDLELFRDRIDKRLIKDYNIRTPSGEVQVAHLSGGNQQKVVIARELSAKPGRLQPPAGQC